MRLRSLGPVDTVVRGYPHPIAEAQTDPIVSSVPHSVLVPTDSTGARGVKTNTRLILMQSQWDVTADALAPTIERYREAAPEAKIVFLDWYAPAHIAQTGVLPLVDLYVKKHVLRDRLAYSKGMHDTNLVEYEAEFRPEFLDTKFLQDDAEEVEQKLFVGWNFATDPGRIGALNEGRHHETDRPIDLHCRICAPDARDTWYTHMRGRAFDAIQRLAAGPLASGNVLCETRRLAYRDYLNEITQSKLCFSPFGYGEVCWRDFEAILSGAVLVKPDMSHLETRPDIYRPHETYVPVRWDFADLEDQCHRYLADKEAREQLTRNAARVWRDYLATGWPEDWRRLQDRLGLTPRNASPLG